ncbi:hypothetical protein HPT25_00650 [Bacillus sp. BRMEA1]|uniref:type IV pilus modification PilV family protein n=1 Tax=Neobacillus endophyticus TaxID=2738405 RepID=UPI001563191B|nr:prepilin-type N-terminal cleavage/methylation domain-containing protein [Neobacillus endophyticus]NRD76016.1 hypothetical protein [Neobacillus endophyticus]
MIRNEKGYTLILVLIIMSVSMILSLGLIGGTLTASKQFNKTDNRNKATDLAEMGVTYFLQVNNSVLQEAKNSNPSNFCSTFTSIIKDQNNTRGYYTNKNVDGNNRYQITLDNNLTSSCSTNPNSFKVVFYSTGTTDTNEKATLTGTFTISKQSISYPRSGESAPNQSNFSKRSYLYNEASNTGNKYYYGDITYNDQPKDVTLYNTAWFNSITLLGGRTLTINNDAIFNNISNMSDISMNGQSNITVNGDAIFYGQKPVKQTQKTSICVTGNPYYVQNGVLTPFTDFGDYFQLTSGCQQTSPVSSWVFDNNTGVTVNYN